MTSVRDIYSLSSTGPAPKCFDSSVDRGHGYVSPGVSHSLIRSEYFFFFFQALISQHSDDQSYFYIFQFVLIMILYCPPWPSTFRDRNTSTKLNDRKKARLSKGLCVWLSHQSRTESLPDCYKKRRATVLTFTFIETALQLNIRDRRIETPRL